MKYNVVFVLCSGSAGSSMFGHIFGAHPKATNLGEFSYMAGGRYNKHGYSQKVLTLGECVTCGNNCEKWHKFREILQKPYYFDAAFRVFNTPYLIDTSKKIKWYTDMASRINGKAKIIRLTRNIYSRLRKAKKRKGKLTTSVLSGWINKEKALTKLLKNKHHLVVKYEDLCEGSGIRDSCNFLGLDYKKEMLQYWTVPQHGIGGDSNARALISANSDEQKDFVENHGFTIRKRDCPLSKKEVKMIVGCGADAMNRSLGYK
jgi:hypothetical protein